jgi:microcompartment protein CcmK/EutM
MYSFSLIHISKSIVKKSHIFEKLKLKWLLILNGKGAHKPDEPVAIDTVGFGKGPRSGSESSLLVPNLH